jgi:hypothetical protein
MTTRYVAGRLHLPGQPEPGTLLGPKDTTREHMVVIGQDGDDTLVSYATAPEVAAAVQRMADGEAPRSIAEHRLAGQARALAARQEIERDVSVRLGFDASDEAMAAGEGPTYREFAALTEAWRDLIERRRAEAGAA